MGPRSQRGPPSWEIPMAKPYSLRVFMGFFHPEGIPRFIGPVVYANPEKKTAGTNHNNWWFGSMLCFSEFPFGDIFRFKMLVFGGCIYLHLGIVVLEISS